MAKNVLKWGTGGINIDGCRVETIPDKSAWTANRKTSKTFHGDIINNEMKHNAYVENQGRFPANFIHDGSDEVKQMFPDGGAQAPVKKGQDGKSRGIYGDYADKGDDGASFYGDNGSASRFFKACEFTEDDIPAFIYCAKASKTDRNDGNNHPTVKPVTLMSYLIKLITPAGGTVLDPFVGSGTTMISCVKNGIMGIGIELIEDHLNIAITRVKYHGNNLKVNQMVLDLFS